MCALFGYVRIYKPLLRFCEYDAYKAVYCSICRELGRSYGIPARLLLNYDFTFVAMLHLALHGQPYDPEKKRCTCNPLKKCLYCKCGEGACDGEAFRVTSAMTVLMFRYKLDDNIDDGGFFARTGCRLLRGLSKGMYRKAAKSYPELDDAIRRCMEMQREAEANPECSLDEAAHPSALMLRELAVTLSDKELDKTVLRDFGYYFGRWIYLIDAFDDLARDLKDGSFNVFARRFGLGPEDADEDSPRLAEARQYANDCLNMTAARAIKAFDLLDTGAYAPVFENILMHGLGEAQRVALHEKELQQNE